jgi:insulysin
LEDLVKKEENLFKTVPYMLNTRVFDSLVRSPWPSPFDTLEAAHELSFEGFQKFCEGWLQNIRTEWLVVGNMTEAQCLSMTKECNQKVFQLASGSKVLPKEKINETRVVNIPPNNSYVYTLLSKNPEEENSCVELNYQISYDEAKAAVLVQVMSQIINEPAFNTLRTTENLGYVVFTRAQEPRGVWFLKVLVQSHTKCPEYVSQRIRAFIDSQRDRIKALGKEEFDQCVHSVIVKVTEKDKNINSHSLRLWDEIVRHQYEFERKEKLEASLKALTLEEFKEFFERTLFESPRLIEVQIMATGHEKENKELREMRTGSFVAIPSFAWFQRRMAFYPDFFTLI